MIVTVLKIVSQTEEGINVSPNVEGLEYRMWSLISEDDTTMTIKLFN